MHGGTAMESVRRLRSSHLGNDRAIWIREPRDSTTSHNLVIFLDAELYRDRIGATSIIDALQGEIADSWIVFVSEESAASRRRECPCYAPFSRFIAEELIEFLGREVLDFGTVKRKSLVGVSYTGLAAAYVAKEFPETFQNIICQSASLWWNECWLVDEYRHFSSCYDLAFYLDVGVGEKQENVDHGYVFQRVSQIDAVRRFRDVLLDGGIPTYYREFDGAHEYDKWAQTLPDALRWCVPVESVQDPFA
jgi:enterochelin esterase-like enzyme